MGFFKSLFGGSKSDSTSEKKSGSTQSAEKMFDEACELQAVARFSAMSGDGIDWEAHQKAIDLFKQSLSQGLSGRNQVWCRFRLGNLLYEKSFQSNYSKISKEGLDSFTTLSAAVSELEKAILLDSQLGNLVFSDEEVQADLLKLDVVWGAQSSYLKSKNGYDAAISYLMKKVELIRFLKVSLPSLYFSLGMNYAESGKISEAKDMFRTARSAEDYSDELDEDDFFYEAAQIAKKDAANNLQYLETYGKLP